MESIALKYVHQKKEQDLLQQLNNLNYLKIEWTVRNASYVQINDVLGEVTYTIREIRERLFSSYEVSETYSFKLLAPCEGYLYITEEELLYNGVDGAMYWDSTEPKIYINDLQRLAFVFQSISELFLYHYQTEGAKIETDPYTNTNTIKWENIRAIYSDDDCLFHLDFVNDHSVFVFKTDEKLRKGDCISLLFDNNQIIDYPIQKVPTKGLFMYESYFTLYKEDVDLLLNHQLVSYRISYFNNRLPAKTTPVLSLYLLSYQVLEEISINVRCYLDALNRLVPNYKFPQRSITEKPTEFKVNWCYVYLMKDVSNGYHKIGISNTPEYRERTLQSEKPTIEMLACKKYPTRKIAEAIESALHTAYSQQRLRGEWFNLTDADVAAIIETLK